MNRMAKEVADSVGAKLEGDGSFPLSGVASPERAGARDLIYVDAAKHADRAIASGAQVVVAQQGIALPGKTVLRVANAKFAFAKAALLLRDTVPIAHGVHPTAVIAPLARVHPTASVGPFAVIGEDAHIGEFTQIGAHSVIGSVCWIGNHCRIHPRVTLYSGVRLGHRVEIHSGAVIGADGFGYAHGDGRHWKFPQVGIVEIGDDVEIGSNTTIDRGSLDDTLIGEGVKLDNLVHVAHNVRIGAHTMIAAQVGFSGSCTVGKNVFIGGQAGFGERCEIEDGAIIGGQSGVLGEKTIRAGQFVWGTPAREMEKFKQVYVWQARLPELAERIKQLEAKLGKG
jgi:UDP-3-O-[3-hydroxymyristoyl] glucosamine N-acyltransferase